MSTAEENMSTAEENMATKKGVTQKTNQYIAAIAAVIGAMIAGTLLGWTSPVNPQLTPANNYSAPAGILINTLGHRATFLLTTTEMSVVSSILAIGAAVAALPVGVLAQKVGRRPTILALTVPFLINWLLTIFANGAGMLIAARFFGGLGTGGICVAAPMYIGEIAETSIRGSLGAFFQLFLTIGILFAYVVGGWTYWKTLSSICAIFVPTMFGVFWYMPETPQYLIRNNHRRHAERSLRWLRGPDADLTLELKEIQKEIDSAIGHSGDIGDMMASPGPRMALICGLSLMFFQQFSGINVIIFYTNDIFRSAGSTIPSVIATIIVGIIQTVATFLSSLLVDKAGRKCLLLQSCIIMGINLLVLGVYFRLQVNGYKVSSFSWLPLLCLVLFIISFALGFGPMPWIMMAELYPVEFRGVATGFTVVTNWLMVFVVTLCFPIMKNAIGIHNCFWFFAGIMGICVLFVSFKVPETKGKSMTEIQDILAGKKS